MLSLNRDFFEKQAMPLFVSGNLRILGQFQGKQDLLLHRRPQLLKALREIAMIQSAESSNRIEGITVAPDRINAMVAKSRWILSMCDSFRLIRPPFFHYLGMQIRSFLTDCHPQSIF